MKISTPKYNWQSYNFGSISLCMIMKNEEKVLARCLNSVQGLVNEIIIVDTGSTDNSIRIAEAYGAKIVEDPWQDDFARPRNLSLELARGSWILILDPDEIIRPEDHAEIRRSTNNNDFDAFWVTTRNYGPYTYKMDYVFSGPGGDPLRK